MLKNYSPSLPVKSILVDGLPEPVYIKSWSQRQKNVIASNVDTKNMDKTYVKILAASLCDESGQLMYSEKEAECLLDYPSQMIETVVKEAYAFNGIDLSAVAEKKSN